MGCAVVNTAGDENRGVALDTANARKHITDE